MVIYFYYHLFDLEFTCLNVQPVLTLMQFQTINSETISMLLVFSNGMLDTFNNNMCINFSLPS